MPDYQSIARNIAVQQGIDPNYFLGQIRAESNFDPTARSPAGALGIAQIVPRWHPGVDPMNPIAALKYAAQHDANLLKQYGGDWRDVLSVYNSGQPGKWRDPNFSGGQTYNYVRKILGENYTPGALGAAAPASSVPAVPPTATPSVPTPSALPSAATMPTQTMPAQPNITGAVLGSLGKGPGELLNSIMSAVTTAQAAPRVPVPSTTLSALPPPTPAPGGATVPSSTNVVVPGGGGKGRAGVAEAFYDPLGSWDNGRFGGAIGNHDDHVHISAATPATMLRAIRLAKSMGLAVRENPYVDPVDPVHVQGSYHYKTFPGKYGGKQLGEAIDVSGSADRMAAYYKAMTGSK